MPSQQAKNLSHFNSNNNNNPNKNSFNQNKIILRDQGNYNQKSLNVKYFNIFNNFFIEYLLHKQLSTRVK